MAVRIKFDGSHNVIRPTFVLMTKSGKRLGSVPAYDIHAVDNFKSAFELSFKVQKYSNGVKYHLWDDLTDFKVLWCKEYKICFEINVQLDEEDDSYKTVTCKSLGESELSKIKTGGLEVNTEDDIEREDYIPTVLYNQEKKEASLVDRVIARAPHYSIKHVDTSIKNIQRTFSLDGSILDAFNTISEEINCIFVIDSRITDSGKIAREISVYDLESYCLECGHREEFYGDCPNCGSENVLRGYGDDTTIFISTDNLADGITYSTDVDSVMNCFKLEAGDDLMTATVASCNPNGTQYLWYISDELKRDMSDELVEKINAYDEKYAYYQNEFVADLNKTNILSKYNNLVTKYNSWNSDLNAIPSNTVGYSALMNAYFDTIDMNLYLEHSMMPSVTTQDTTATKQAAKLKSSTLSPVAITNLSSASGSTASSAVLAMAKTLVSPLYQVRVNEYSYNTSTKVWTGSFNVTNYSDSEDTATSSTFSVALTDNFEKYVKQVVEKALTPTTEDVTDIVGLFKLGLADFKTEIKKYSLVRLNSFYDSCTGCINVLIQQGVADKEKYENETNNLYEDIYLPYYNKLSALADEIEVRENEIAIVTGKKDELGLVLEDGIQTIIESIQAVIQNELNFEEYIGEDLWLEFVSYRREDTYSNDNFISDGLDNAQLFEYAQQFFEMAKKEIYKSSTLQHSITATLKNLLVMKEFEPIVDNFSVGNWIRIRVDDKIHKLRILSYEIDYENLDSLTIEFSDVKNVVTGISDFESIMSKADSMSSSYDFVARQANKGRKGNQQLVDWVNKGLSLTKMKIIDDAENQNIVWDSHGLLCREYSEITDDYSDKQLKIINSGLYLTNDNWLTSKAGIGDFVFYNPETGKYEEAYGVIADTIIGNLILSERVGIYNPNGSITMNQDGLIITTFEDSDSDATFVIRRETTDENGNKSYDEQLFIDTDGNLVLNGTLKIQTADESGETTKHIDDIISETRNEITIRYDELQAELGSRITINENNIRETYTTIDANKKILQEYTDQQLGAYKAEVGQYMEFTEDGLTIGASTSSFKTVIDNQNMRFMDNDKAVAYIGNRQLYIQDAVIKNTLSLGNFFFNPRNDGGVSLTWQGD